MKGFSKLDNPSHEGQTNTWLTPLWLVRALGEFDLDPCGFPGHETAEVIYTLPLTDGLSTSWLWKDRRVFLNPPYGKHVGLWLSKLEQHGNGIALVFARTDTKWFHSLSPDCVFFIQGRIKFLRPDFTSDTNAGHGSMLLAWGENNVRAIHESGIKGMMLTKQKEDRL